VQSLFSDAQKLTNSPYINRFCQPDTIIPDLSNPQSWNRYSYVTNRPVNFSDPSGHMLDDGLDGEGGGCDSDCLKKKRTDVDQILKSTVKLGFGDLSCVSNPRPGCSFGLGTLVGDRQTIYTAFHVYDMASNKTFLYQTSDGKVYALSGVTWSRAPGTDVMVLHLPFPLGSTFVPASMNKGYIPSSGDNVSVAYKDDHSDYRGLHVLPTSVRPLYMIQPGQYSNWQHPVTGTGVYDPVDLNTDNPVKKIVNSGDSGGGVFYNGYFVGVSSYVNDDEIGSFMVFEQP
jgi:hypothetical protein